MLTTDKFIIEQITPPIGGPQQQKAPQLVSSTAPSPAPQMPQQQNSLLGTVGTGALAGALGLSAVRNLFGNKVRQEVNIGVRDPESYNNFVANAENSHVDTNND